MTGILSFIGTYFCIAERCFDFILDNLHLVSSYKRDSAALTHCPSRVTAILNCVRQLFYDKFQYFLNRFPILKSLLSCVNSLSILYVRIVSAY